MALALIVDAIDSVPEALRGEYTEKDGKFHLNVEGIEKSFVPRDVHKKSNDEAAQRRHQLSAWEKLGKTPEEIAALLAEIENEGTEKLKKKGDFEALMKQHQDKSAKREKELQDELNAARASERSAIVGERLISALTKAGVTEEGTELLPDRLANRIKFETVDGKRVLKIMQADGETPMAGSGADGTATLDDLAKEAVTKYPSLFKGEGRGGGGKSPNGQGGGGSGVVKKSDFKTEKERAAWVDANGMAAYSALPDR